MNKMPNTILMLLLIGSLVLNGCGGGSVFADGGIGGTGISTGTVTGIGSITVNGVTYNTDNAAIYIEGRRVDDQCIVAVDAEDCLRNILGFSEGQVVRVVENFDADGRTGTADEVYYNDSVEGQIQAKDQIDATTFRLQVLEQFVIVDSQTLLVGTTLTDIGNTGHDQVEVSGLRDANGQIKAGFVRNTIISDPDESSLDEIKGVIDSIDPLNPQFTINSLIVDYTNVSSFTPQIDTQVEVKGDFDGGLLVATSIELEDDINGGEDDEIEYEGIVTDTTTFATDGQFTLGTETIKTTSSTQYKGGVITDIADGVHLEAEGFLQAGTLIAEEIRFRDSIEIDAQVAGHTTTLAEDSVTIMLTGLTGINVFVNSESEINVSTGNDDLAGLISALRSGDTDYVEVRGRCFNCVTPLPAERDVYAEEIKLDDNTSNSKVKLQGQSEEIDEIANSITILGIDISTDPTMEFEAIDDTTSLTQAEFFNLITVGNLVGAEGNLNAGNVDWDKLEIEDDK